MPQDDTIPRILTVLKPDDGKPVGEWCSALMTVGVRRRNTKNAKRKSCPMKATRFLNGKPYCDEHGPGRWRIDPFYTSPQWKALRRKALDRDNHTCRYCGWPATQADHIIARSKGGADALDNLAACCPTCNKIAGGQLFKSFNDKKSWLLAQRKKVRL